MDPIAFIQEPLVFGPVLILLVIEIIKHYVPFVAKEKWPIPLLALGIAFGAGYLMLEALDAREFVLQCFAAAIGAMGLHGGIKTLGRSAKAGINNFTGPRGPLAMLLMFALLLPLVFVSAGCATGGNFKRIDTAMATIGEKTEPPKRAARGPDGNALLDKDGAAILEDKDVVTWRFRKFARDDDPIDHWSERMLEATTTALGMVASYLTDPWVGPALLLSNSMIPVALFDTSISDYAVASDVSVKIYGDDLRLAVGKALSHRTDTADTEEKSEKVATDLTDGGYIFAAVYGDLKDADREFIKDLFSVELTAAALERSAEIYDIEGEAFDNAEEIADGR